MNDKINIITTTYLFFIVQLHNKRYPYTFTWLISPQLNNKPSIRSRILDDHNKAGSGNKMITNKSNPFELSNLETANQYIKANCKKGIDTALYWLHTNPKKWALFPAREEAQLSTERKIHRYWLTVKPTTMKQRQ